MLFTLALLTQAATPGLPVPLRADLYWQDFDLDGRPEVLALAPGEPARLLGRAPSGEFVDIGARAGLPAVEGARAALWGDVDGDGRPDLLLVVPGSAPRLWLNLPGGALHEVGREAGLDASAATAARLVDLDGDAWPDLELATDAAPELWLNLGQGRFERVGIELPVRVGTPRALGDAERTPQEDDDADLDSSESPARGTRSAVAIGAAASASAGASSAPPPPGGSSQAAVVCADSVLDQSGMGACIPASSVPFLGSLYPLSTAFNVTPAGRIGIGTAAPAWSVHVEAAQGVLRLDSTTATNGSVLELRNKTASPAFLGAINAVNSAGAFKGQIAFTGDDQLTVRVGGTERLRVDANGWLGVGSVPSAPLDVAPTSAGPVQLDLPGLLVFRNTPTSPMTIVHGSPFNFALFSPNGATVGGGGDNAAGNVVADDYCTVAGGYDNAAGDSNPSTTSAMHATVSGGHLNRATDQGATISGGGVNIASGSYDTVGGGQANEAKGTWSTVAGGFNNEANAVYAVVPGGSDCQANGFASLAAGWHARANHTGCFVWGDSSGGSATIASTADHQFVVRASGGVWLGTTSTPSLPAGRFLNTSTGGYLSSGGTWTNSSDRDLKQDFRDLDAGEVLERVARLPLTSWSYIEQPDVRHVGPMAQDFHAAFGLGEDDEHIATVDADGVALAAIQGLNELVTRQAEQIRALEARLDALEGRR